jgi:hypothetical protein
LTQVSAENHGANLGHPAKVPDALVRVNITARESQIEQIDRLAEAAGMTRSAYMVQSAIATARRSRPERTHSSQKRA